MSRVVSWNLLLILAWGAATASSQPTQSEDNLPFNVANGMYRQLSRLGADMIAMAEAMPAEKYSWVPTAGEFTGARNFGEQLKHAAQSNFILFSTMLLRDNPPGPEALKTKTEIVKYLKDSFALAHDALAAITETNYAEVISHANNGPKGTRVGMAFAAYGHSSDVYGQVVEYLRMTGIVPPQSRPKK